MSENENEHRADIGSLCLSCKAHPYLENSPSRICKSCREKLIKYPIPKWIWGFAGGILIIMLIGAFRMPAYVKAALKVSRAEKFMEAKKYVSAQKELKEVLEKFPNNKNANGMMVIASCYNWDSEQMNKSFGIIENVNFDDNELLSEINAALAYFSQSYPKDTTLLRRIYEIKDDTQQLKNLFVTMDSLGDQDFPIAGFWVCQYLNDLEEYEASARILERVLDVEPNLHSALLLNAAVKRNLEDYVGSIASCKRALSINKEDVMTLSLLSRIELKRRNDEQAAYYANLAMELLPENIYAMEAQSMVDFYAGRRVKSKKLLADIQKQEVKTGDSTISKRLSLIINQTEIYR
jgi:tetratricopeptide (TPR) repeat protein